MWTCIRSPQLLLSAFQNNLALFGEEQMLIYWYVNQRLEARDALLFLGNSFPSVESD